MRHRPLRYSIWSLQNLQMNKRGVSFFGGSVENSGGRKSKSGIAKINTVFNPDFCQIVFGFGLYLRFQNQIVFGFGLYLRQLVYWIYGCQYLNLDSMS